MSDLAFLSAFAFEQPETPVSLYDYAPVFRVRDERGEWVAKRTGLVHSDGEAIGQWLSALQREGIAVVAPAGHLSPNPRRLADGRQWVVYPFVRGTPYSASAAEICAAGALLGWLHAADVPEAAGLLRHDQPVVRPAAWITGHFSNAEPHMARAGIDVPALRRVLNDRIAHVSLIEGLPLAGCSFDFKASNLVFAPHPVLIDPDHAAMMPRLFDLAIAVLLFHCDLPTTPGRMWTEAEWDWFLDGYRSHVVLQDMELVCWQSVLSLAWLDQAIWLFANWPEGWDDPKERDWLIDLATVDLGRFTLRAPGC